MSDRSSTELPVTMSGLERDDVAWLIDAVNAAELTREEKLNLFRDQFEDPAGAALCEACAAAFPGATFGAV